MRVCCLRIHSVFLLLISIVCHGISQDVWRETTFHDFRNGTFDDSGANMYVSAQGRIQAIKRWDVNQNGNIDILSVNSHPLIEMLDLSIYWGNGKDYSIKNHTYIPVNGPMWVTADDVNGNGVTDLIVANYSNGTWTQMDSYIYYGCLDEAVYEKDDGEWKFYPFCKRQPLPSINAQKAVTGDFNQDGYTDIVIAFSGGYWEYRDRTSDGVAHSRIYWGTEDGFYEGNYTEIRTSGATDVVSADVNKNGWLDLIFANSEGGYSFIYYGGENGYSDVRMTKLPTNKAHAVAVGDLNGNGWLDVLFANEEGTVSFAYMNTYGEYSADNRIEFETYTAKGVVVADFNNNGYKDVFFSNHQHSLSGDPNLANRLIDSYIYFGSEDGFDHENRLSMPTIGAWGAAAADLNNNGWIDLVVANFQEHYSYEVPTFIYWNGPDGFSENKRTPLYEHGATGVTIADLNNDGFPEILITSMMGNSRGDYDPSFLYIGTDDGGFDVDNPIELLGREPYGFVFADFDDNGYVDIALANRGETTRLANEVWIYWNMDNTFHDWYKSGLPAFNAVAVRVADLDRDGYLDLIVSTGPTHIHQADKAEGSFIYWGGPDGWTVSERTVLPIIGTRAPGIADINNNGHLDLIFGSQQRGHLANIFFGDGTRGYSIENSVQLEESYGTGNAGVADLNNNGLLDLTFAHDRHVLVYYQEEDYTFGRPVVLPVQAKTMSIADVNSDGWLDLICPLYKDGGNRIGYSTIVLGSAEGFNLSNTIQLETHGGTGALAADFNRDGYMDIFFYNHRSDGSYSEIKKFGDHHVNSVLYYGGPDGYNNENILELPGIGAHYDAGVDIGHIRNRQTKYRYISSAYKTSDKVPISIDWQAEIPVHTQIHFQLRVADSETGLATAKWFGPQGPDTWFTEPTQINQDIKGEWIQYSVLFDMGNGSGTPVLESVEISFK
jgi:hypothetical protein